MAQINIFYEFELQFSNWLWTTSLHMVKGPQKLKSLGLGTMGGSRIGPSKHYYKRPTWEIKGQEERSRFWRTVGEDSLCQTWRQCIISTDWQNRMATWEYVKRQIGLYESSEEGTFCVVQQGWLVVHMENINLDSFLLSWDKNPFQVDCNLNKKSKTFKS